MQHIVIVGGGMVGLSLALLLAEKKLADITITVLEKSPEPHAPSDLQQASFDARSTALSAGTAGILATIGCWQRLEPHTEAIRQIHVSDQSHFGGCQLKSEDYQSSALGYVVENRHLGQALHEVVAAKPIQLFYSACIQAALPKSNGYDLQVSLNSEETKTLHADLLVLADGAESGLRQELGIDTRQKDYGQIALVANVALAQAHRGQAYERFTQEGPLAVLPLPDSSGQYRGSLVWTFEQDKRAWLEGVTNTELMAELQKTLGFRTSRITAIGERQIYPLKLLQAREQIRSSLVVLGNAAHALHPVAGQGFNLSLRDCQGLAKVIYSSLQKGERLGNLASLQRYEQLRSSDQERTIGITDSLVKLFSSQDKTRALARQMGLWALNHLPSAKKHFGSMMMGRANFR